MRTRTILLSVFCCFVFIAGKSQDYKHTFYLDENFAITQKQNATILGKGLPDNGLFKLDCFTLTGDYHFLTAYFKDSTLTVLEGPFKSFYKTGRIEKEGSYENGAEAGVWQHWDSTGAKVDSMIYKAGKPIIQATFSYYENGAMYYYAIKDSLQDTYRTFTYDDHASLHQEVFFKGQRGVLKTYSKEGAQTDSLFTREEEDAMFAGGDEAWALYLQRTLNPDVPVKRKASAGKYTVIIKFIVSIDGSLKDITAETNLGHGMEQEAIRVIKNSPKWIPAKQYGRKVNAYRRQPVTFLVEAE